MSWTRAVSRGSDDVFEDHADELKLQSKEWNNIMEKRLKGGYVDGVDAGEESSLQLGFNQGFREGAAKTRAVGRLKGIVSAISCWCQMENPESPVPVRVAELLQWVSKHEERVIEGIVRSMESPPPSVGEVSESMEDLEVDQSGRCCSEDRCEETDSCRTGQKDLETSEQNLCSPASRSPPLLDPDLNFLLQWCSDVVVELGLPQDLLSPIEELKNI